MAASKERLGRWYFGGVASSAAACFTHPLDLLKVHLQTQQEGHSSNVFRLLYNIARLQGVSALYNGLTASLLRQATYSTTRFGIYEISKQHLLDSHGIPFYQKVLVAGVAGACGGFVGTPADMINVRMQNDIKLPFDQRRKRVLREESVTTLFSGASMATARAMLMTIGQISFYDQLKYLLLETPWFEDTLSTHFICSLCAGLIATSFTQPLDVLKTRAMNAKPGEYQGYVPAFIRLGPHTILTFIFLEQLKKYFGYIP